MPLSIPAFDQYQQPLIPLRGLWNKAPVEGDQYVNAEINWLVTTKSAAVQFSLSGNSPVALSQIVALCVDNSRSGADVQFVFPDSGFVLTTPAHTQLVAPVFTNALMFYASAPNCVAGDTTVFQILNSMPPPIPITPSSVQNHASVAGVPVTNGTTVILPASVTGTLNTLLVDVTLYGGAGVQTGTLALIDGTGAIVWETLLNVAANATVSQPMNLSGLDVRFVRGLSCVVSSSNFTGGFIVVNVYYSTP